ncbi:uncharacterized protein [Acropora muricata]|uniref:uncharacterized protein n=1 Tax=Acropora muricata TaxID=159855 RepID=UPI0034E3F73D
MAVKNPKNRQEEIKEEFKCRQLAARFCAMKEDYKQKLGLPKCDNLKDLSIKCLFISDNDGTGTMEVYGHPSAVRFVESSQLAAKFFAFVNGEGKLCGRSVKVPFKEIISSNKSSLRVTNMPEGINFKHPSNYGVRTLHQILSTKDNIVFQFDDRNSSSTIARSTVAPMALGVATTSTTEITSSATTNSSPLVSASQSSSTSSSSSEAVFPSSANIISPSASETVFPTSASTISQPASETVFPTTASTISQSA